MIYQLSCRITGACVGGSLIKIWACVCKMIFSLPLSLALSTKRSLSKLLILLALCLIMKFRLFWLQEWPPTLSEKRLSSAVVAVTTSHLHAKIIHANNNTVVSPSLWVCRSLLWSWLASLSLLSFAFSIWCWVETSFKMQVIINYIQDQSQESERETWNMWYCYFIPAWL